MTTYSCDHITRFQRQQVKGLYTVVPVLLIILVTVLSAPRLAAQMAVTPPRVLIEGQNRSAEITLTNTSSSILEVTSDVGYALQSSDSLGNIGLRQPETPIEEAHRCDSFLQVYPYRFTIKPNESRTVRLLLLPRPTVKPGEYWARLRLTGVPSDFDLTQVLDTVSGIEARIRTAIRLDLPVIFRFGEVRTEIEFDSVRLFLAPGGQLATVVRTLRQGNAAYRGTLFGSLVDSGGTTVRQTHVQYTTEFHGWNRLDFGAVAPGTYTLRLRSESVKQGSAMDVVLPSLPVEASYAVRVSDATAEIDSQ